MLLAHVQRDLERAAQAVKAKQAQRTSKGVDKKDKYWLKRGDAERRECVDIYVKRDMKGIQLHYGTPHPPPPRTTIRSWGEKFAEGITVSNPVGRPSFLRAEEKEDEAKCSVAATKCPPSATLPLSNKRRI